jgi:hypothetical protein
LKEKRPHASINLVIFPENKRNRQNNFASQADINRTVLEVARKII